MTPGGRGLYHGGLNGYLHWTRLDVRNQSTWIREVQRSKDRQLVDIRRIIQLLPRSIQNVDMRAVISKDLSKWMERDSSVERITPSSIKEVNWESILSTGFLVVRKRGDGNSRKHIYYDEYMCLFPRFSNGQTRLTAIKTSKLGLMLCPCRFQNVYFQN